MITKKMSMASASDLRYNTILQGGLCPPEYRRITYANGGHSPSALLRGTNNMKRIIACIGVCAVALTLFAPQVFAESQKSENSVVVVENGKVNGKSLDEYILAEVGKGIELSDIIRLLLQAKVDLSLLINSTIESGVSPVTVAKLVTIQVPDRAAEIAAAAAKAAPDQAVQIAAAVIAAAPAQTAKIVAAVSVAVPQASLIELQSITAVGSPS